MTKRSFQDLANSGDIENIYVGGTDPAQHKVALLSDIGNYIKYAESTISLTSAVDIDDILIVGHYRWSSSSVPINAPDSQNALMFIDKDGDNFRQIIHSGNTEQELNIYERTSLAGIYTTNWTKNLIENDIGISIAAYAHTHTGVYELDLNDPASDGYILSSTAGGTRSWVAPGTVAGVLDIPEDGNTTDPISANWAYDHENASDPHGTTYIHPDSIVSDIYNSGADIIHRLETNSTGHITLMQSRTLTLNDLSAGNSATLDVGTIVDTVAAGDHNHTTVYEPADSTILKDADKYTNQLVGEIETVEDLHTLGVGTENQLITVFGFLSTGDGGGGNWYWDATKDKAYANIGTILDTSVAFTLAAQGTGIGTGCWIREFSGFADVKWFGAKGDGSTQDEDAIQKAWDNVQTIFFSTGTYKVQGDLVYRDGMSIEIPNSANVIINEGRITPLTNVTGNVHLVVNGHLQQTGFAPNVQKFDWTVVGGFYVRGFIEFGGLNGVHAEGFILEGTGLIEGAWVGTPTHSFVNDDLPHKGFCSCFGNKITIRGLEFKGFQAECIYNEAQENAPSIDVVFEQNYVHECKFTAYNFNHDYDSVNCVIRNNRSNNTGIGIELSSGIADGNELSNAEWGFATGGLFNGNIDIKNNRVTDCLIGIFVWNWDTQTRAQLISVTNNTVARMQNKAIDIEGQEIFITNNVLIDYNLSGVQGNNAIKAHAFQNGVVSGNLMRLDESLPFTSAAISISGPHIYAFNNTWDTQDGAVLLKKQISTGWTGSIPPSYETLTLDSYSQDIGFSNVFRIGGTPDFTGESWDCGETSWALRSITVDGGTAEYRISNYKTSAADTYQDSLVVSEIGTVKPGQDNVQLLGNASYRWSEVFAGTDIINTSDEREKQQIQALSTVEQAVAVKLKAAIKTFKFNDAVTSKGDGARIHVGIIAQDVKTIFESEGLVAENYSLFCYDEWDEEIDGTTGVVKHTAGNLYGIRYAELLAFIISAL